MQRTYRANQNSENFLITSIRYKMTQVSHNESPDIIRNTRAWVIQKLMNNSIILNSTNFHFVQNFTNRCRTKRSKRIDFFFPIIRVHLHGYSYDLIVKLEFFSCFINSDFSRPDLPCQISIHNIINLRFDENRNILFVISTAAPSILVTSTFGIFW